MWLSGRDPEAHRQSQAPLSLSAYGVQKQAYLWGSQCPTIGTPALNCILWGLAYSMGQGLHQLSVSSLLAFGIED